MGSEAFKSGRLLLLTVLSLSSHILWSPVEAVWTAVWIAVRNIVIGGECLTLPCWHAVFPVPHLFKWTWCQVWLTVKLDIKIFPGLNCTHTVLKLIIKCLCVTIYNIWNCKNQSLILSRFKFLGYIYFYHTYNCYNHPSVILIEGFLD